MLMTATAAMNLQTVGLGFSTAGLPAGEEG
jgi:hypothetical protein